MAFSRPAWLSSLSRHTSGYPTESMRGLRTPLGGATSWDVLSYIILKTAVSQHFHEVGGFRMISSRKTAIIVGVLFIIGTIAGVLSVLFTGPILDDPDYLTKVASNQNQIIMGVLLVLIMGFALAMVPVMMFPIFRKYNEALALGSIVFRGVLEAVTYIAIVITWLLLLTLSQEYMKAGAPDASYFQTLGTLLLIADDWIAQILAIVFSLGALAIYYLFYQSKLIPRWLSIWGLIGAILYLAAPLLAMFGFVLEILMAPLALQEMVLAIWLIAKGLNASENTSLPQIDLNKV
jgi:hypothetical protein